MLLMIQVHAMHSVNANLLLALDALLSQGSVAGAARRVGVSPPAMSRTLQRLREALADPLLVRAGRRMVPTPRALALRPRVGEAAREVRSLLAPAGPLDLGTMERTFTVRASDHVAAVLGPRLDARLAREAPAARLVLVAEGTEDLEPLRAGELDLDVGRQETLGPELRVRKLYEEPMVAVVREGHPLARGRITPRRLAGAAQVVASHDGGRHGVAASSLQRLGLPVRVDRVVPSHLVAAWWVTRSDLLAVVPSRFAAAVAAPLGLRTVALGVALPRITIALAWHPRHDGDAAHRWLRGCVVRAAQG
jgi:DNA-binding transcriptional LysR family regulator